MKIDNQIRVLYYIAYPLRLAGANRSLFELITNLPPSVKPLVILTAEGMVADAYRAAGIETQIIPPGKFLNQYGKAMLKWSVWKQAWVALTELLPYTLKLSHLIRQLEIDLVHLNDPRGVLLMGLASRLAQCPTVGHMRGDIPFNGVGKSIFETFSDRIIMVCSAIRSSLSSQAQKKAVTVYNGIKDISNLGGEEIPWLQYLQFQKHIIVCCFASIVPFKGHHHLLEAVAELNQRGWGDRVIFVCVGDFVSEYKDYQAWLFERQQKLKVNNLIFAGWQSDPFAFYKLADISVLASVAKETLNMEGQVLEVQGNEGFPRTHLEAMCFSLPIVGTNIAGVPEQIENNVNGFVVPPADKTALATALEKLIMNSELRVQMGKAGREKVLNLFSTQAYVSGVLDVYKTLVCMG